MTTKDIINNNSWAVIDANLSTGFLQLVGKDFREVRALLEPTYTESPTSCGVLDLS